MNVFRVGGISIVVERSLEGTVPKVWREVFSLRVSELSACPFWACTYSMSFTGMCKGQSVWITGENFLVMSFIKDMKKWLNRAIIEFDKDEICVVMILNKTAAV